MASSRDRRTGTPAGITAASAPSKTATLPTGFDAPRERRHILLAMFGIALLGLAAFANSFEGVFVLDDIYEIEQNREMNYLLPPWRSMLAGRVIPARPIPYYTFAIDTAIWKRDPWGYHFFNVAIHLGSALLLFSIVRRTLTSPKLIDRYGAHATLLAFFIAAFWVVHPIQTQAVTYIYQRIESMASFLFLTAFYCFLRSKDSPHPVRWRSGSVAATALAVLSKESAVVIPPVLFLYDVVFLTDSWTLTVKSRFHYYFALLLTFIPLAALLAHQNQKYEEFRTPRSAIGYALSQPAVILRYLELCFYPTEQCLDYLRPMATESSEIIGPTVVILGLIVAAAIGIVRRRPWGWLIAAFFLPLLPTSSFIPVNDLANEHRMYLALATVSTAVVLSGFWAYRYWVAATGRTQPAGATVGLVAAVALASLIGATHLRNRVYFDRVAMWEDVVSKAPHNTRAFENLASACLVAGDTTRAAEAAQRVLSDPKHAHRGHLLLGSAMLDSGNLAGAVEHLSKAIERNPRGASAYNSLGVALRKSDPKRAAELYALALEREPANVEIMINVANSRAREGDFDGAEKILRAALALEPENSRVHEKLSFVLADKQAGS